MPKLDRSENEKFSNGVNSPKELGEILKKARQKKGLTIEKIYKQTRIQPTLIEALEQGRADEILDRVYILLFLKKYGSFLGLNGDGLARDYKTFYTDEEKVILDIHKAQTGINVVAQEWMRVAIPIGAIFIFVFLILFLGAKLKSFYITRRTTSIKEIASTTRIPEIIPKYLGGKKTQTIFPIPKDKPIDLTLRSTDEVWMKIEEDGKIVYTGTLIKNGTKKFSANDEIGLWVGRAEALKFTINGNSIGRIGKGNIRSIRISRRGLKIGDKWLLKAKQSNPAL